MDFRRGVFWKVKIFSGNFLRNWDGQPRPLIWANIGGGISKGLRGWGCIGRGSRRGVIALCIFIQLF